MKNIISLFLLLFIISCNDEAKVVTIHSQEKENGGSDYAEKHRPQAHFSPENMELISPTGLVFYKNEYHLFYQYQVEANNSASKSWGHAVTRNMSTWKNLPVALTPDDLGAILSGSVVVDSKNTTGLGETGKPAMVAIFTQGKEESKYQSLAYSLDNGRTWTKYANNPVLKSSENENLSDPRVFWDEERAQWVMTLATGDHVQMYASLDLKDWKKLSDWGKGIGSQVGEWSSPDLMKMKIQGTNNESKWLLTVSVDKGGPQGGSGTQYFIGEFDGTNFTPDARFGGKEAHWTDYGRDNYRGVSWSNTLPEHRFMIGFMGNHDYAQNVPTDAWKGAMTLPRQWFLVKTNKGIFLRTFVDKLLEALRTTSIDFTASQMLNGTLPLESKEKSFDPSVSEYRLLFKKPEGGSKAIFGLRLYNDEGEEFKVGFDSGRNQFFTDKTKAGKQNFSDKFVTKRHYATTVTDADFLDMHIIIDKSSCELLAEGGFMSMTDIFFPNEDFNHAEFFSEQGEVELRGASASELKSIWQ